MIGGSPLYRDLDAAIRGKKGRSAVKAAVEVMARYQNSSRAGKCRRLEGADGKQYSTCDNPKCDAHNKGYRLTLRSAQRLVDYLPGDLAREYMRLDTRWQILAWSRRRRS